jgi:hypothetical protein
MPTINLSIPTNEFTGDSSINYFSSVQVGDIAYYIPANQLVAGFNVNVNSENCIRIGVIKSIGGGLGLNNLYLICEIDASTEIPEANDFIFFSKSRSVNEASIVGYYGKLRFKNDSKQKAELFSANCNVNISS